MPAGLVSAGLVGADHIEAGPVMAGHIEVSLCPLCSAYPGSAGVSHMIVSRAMQLSCSRVSAPRDD